MVRVCVDAQHGVRQMKADDGNLERRITIVIALLSAALSIPLFVLAVTLGYASLFAPEPRMGILITSFPLTFALFFAVISWRGFASAQVAGAAISPRGWRLLALSFALLGTGFGLAHWFGAFLPFCLAGICLLGDPSALAFLRRLGFG